MMDPDSICGRDIRQLRHGVDRHINNTLVSDLYLVLYRSHIYHLQSLSFIVLAELGFVDEAFRIVDVVTTSCVMNSAS